MDELLEPLTVRHCHHMLCQMQHCEIQPMITPLIEHHLSGLPLPMLIPACFTDNSPNRVVRVIFRDVFQKRVRRACIQQTQREALER